MDCRWTLADHSSPLPFPTKTLPNEIHASQSSYALVSMLTIGDDDDSIFEESPASLLCESGLPTSAINKNKNKNRQAKGTTVSGDEERLVLRENRNSSMPMLQPQRRKSIEDFSHIESALNAVFDIIEAAEGDDCQWNFAESLRGDFNDEVSESKWSSPVTTKVLQKPVRRSSLVYAPHSHLRSAQ
ncbi:unnamed protein product [Cylindrotheca closterium]|uniref:Uncharacterized protein n=1 Tax=Cylindrotheca closterium TaxID=2856 RepID=A0AAD2G4A6_9STRA|nr:unnamed protein product [Cylindrotheca closterium]CAJ1960780.1 unnamed protein product [Cylindrotheca closterium]